jgi:hypothetical protein
MAVRLVVMLAACCATGLAAQTTAPDAAGWRADLALLARELPARHPAPFASLSEARWDSAVASLRRRIPGLSRNQRLVEFFRLVALLGDAHTVVHPVPVLHLRYYPLELYSFEDGLFIRRADPEHSSLVGAKVVRIGRASADQALAAVGTIIPHENEWWVRAWGPVWLMIPELLDGLGIAGDPEHLRLVVERGGQADTITIEPAGRFEEGPGGTPTDMSAWPTIRAAPAPLWEQHPELPFWWTYLPESQTLYVALRAVVPGPRSSTNRGQWDQIFALADSARVARLVIDMRENLGGNGALNRYPVQQILRRPAIDQPDRLFVIIGRRTFSAGQQFANLLEAWTRATFVGEPTGQRPSQYGDHRPLVLPNTGLVVEISSVFHQAPNEFDRRDFVPPASYTPLGSPDYRRGVDPALAAVFGAAGAVPIGEQLGALIAKGDTGGAEQTLRDAQGAVANRFHSLEGEVNALGYRLLGSGATDRAVAVFRLNTRVYPRSANTFDSLGEALLAAGQRDEAIAAYREAVKVEPGFPPSAQALQRLGVP